MAYLSRPMGPRAGKSLPLWGVLVLLLLGCCGRPASGQTESLDIEQVAQRDLYAVLELQPGAEGLDVKTAYRKLARKWHPDKNPDNTQVAQRKFAEIAEAYEILSNESSRKLYDHARRVRAAHDMDQGSGGGGGGGGRRQGRDAFGGDWETDGDWYFTYDGMGGDGGMFGSSFDGSGGGGGSGGGAGGFGAGFGGGPYGGFGGGMGAGAGAGGGAYEFHARDPMELFEALFGGAYFDGSETDYYRQEADGYAQQQQHQQQQQRHDYYRQEADGYAQQQQQQQQRQQQGMSWGGQDFELYEDYEDGGRMYRRVITTVVYGDGSSQSTAQDYVFDKATDRWFVASNPFEYHGPGVAPPGAWASFRGGGGGGEAVDNVLRMNEFLRVGRSITSVDRKFTAVLESDCNFVVFHTWGGGRTKVWETSSFDLDGRCFVTIQDNGMLVVIAGDDPTAPGNVLWSNNQGHVGWLKQNSFHAVILPSGNLVVSQGESPMHPAARICAWGAFGCPGEGGMLEWKLVWFSVRSKAAEIWCKVVRCDGIYNPNDSSSSNSYDYDNGYDTRDSPRGRSGGSGGDFLDKGTAAFRRVADQGLAKLKGVFGKIKAAAEETAYAASRPRHW